MRVVCFIFETLKHISNTTVILESDRFDLKFYFLSHARLIFFPVDLLALFRMLLKMLPMAMDCKICMGNSLH